MRALALGARACMIGRAYAFGLGAGGQAGVAKAIDILEKELSVTMALTGTNKIADIGRQVLVGGGAKKKAAAKKKSLSAVSLSAVMAGHSRPKDGVASLAYVPAIHALAERKRGCPAQGRA